MLREEREEKQKFNKVVDQVNENTKQVEDNSKKLQGIPVFDEFNTLEEYIVAMILKNYHDGGQIYTLLESLKK